MLCPYDEKVFQAAIFLAILLPTDRTSPAGGSPDFLCWFEELLDAWKWIDNMDDWDSVWIFLFSRTAQGNSGGQTVNWEPHLPWLFNKFLASFHLPVGTRASGARPFMHQMPRNCKLLLPVGWKRNKAIAAMIVHLIAPNNSVLALLGKLMTATASFYHPSNLGSWSTSLGGFLYKLIEQFVLRLHDERQADSTTPMELRLTPAMQQEFVELVTPNLLLAHFSKSPQVTAAAIWGFRDLAYVAPSFVLPKIMERIYPALQTVTESHQTLAALSALQAIVRPLFSRQHYPAGAQHLLPLLQLSLPGIDPNDLTKTQITLQFYLGVLQTVALVDCSRGQLDGLPEEEQLVCEATAALEGWCLQFIDAVLRLLDNVAKASSKRHSVERGLGLQLSSVFVDFFQSLSPSLFRPCLEKLFRFVTSHILLTSAKTVGHLCAAASYADPDAALALFVPFVADRILEMAAAHAAVDVAPDTDELEVDDEMIWYLHILARVVKRTGAALLPFREPLIRVLDATVFLCSKMASKLGGKLLRHLLLSLTSTYVTEQRPLPTAQCKQSANNPQSIFNLRGYTTGLQASELQATWHLMSSPELALAEELVSRFYQPAVQYMEQLTGPGAPHTAHRVELRINLMLLRNFVRVGLPLFPESGEPPISDVRTKVPLTRQQLSLWPLNRALEHPDSIGRRERLCAMLSKVVGYLLAQRVDDTKSQRTTLKIIQQLLNVRGVSDAKYGREMATYKYYKGVLLDQLHGGKLHTRALLIRRVQLQWTRRAHQRRRGTELTASYAALLHDLRTLSVSQYAKVRAPAQNVLQQALGIFPAAKQDMLQTVMAMVQSPTSHGQLKGALHLLHSLHRTINRNEALFAQFVEAITTLHHNDKRSIQDLVAKIHKNFAHDFDVVSMEYSFPAPLFNFAVGLYPPAAIWRPLFEGEAFEAVQARGARNWVKRVSLVDTLVRLVTTEQLHWRYELMLASLLLKLQRKDVPIEGRVLQYFARNLVHDSLHMREGSVKAMNVLLEMLKRMVPKEPFVPSPDHWRDHTYQMAPAARPQSKQEYDAIHFVDKNYVGWRHWPASFETYRPGAAIDYTTLSEHDAIVLHLLQDEKFARTAITFMAQEKADGSPGQFQDTRAEFFKGLFRNFGQTLVPVFQPLINELCAVNEGLGTGEQAARERCACEILAGLVRGSKHWPYEALEGLRKWLLQLLPVTLERVSNMSLEDWCTFLRFVVYDRDPRRLYWLTDLLLAHPLQGNGATSSFAQARRLQFLYITLEELSWRGEAPSQQLRAQLETFVGHPFQLVREKIARSLYVVSRNIWQTQPGEAPMVNDDHRRFIQQVIAQIDAARSSAEEQVLEDALRHAKTLLQWLAVMFHDGSSPAVVAYLPVVLPTVFTLPELKEDTELVNLCGTVLGYACQSVGHPGLVDGLFDCLLQTAQTSQWHARRRVLSFLQVTFFRNLFVAPEVRIKETLVARLGDDQVEVRELASSTLSGLIQCGMMDLALLKEFGRRVQAHPLAKRARVVTGKARSTPPVEILVEEKHTLLQRHVGILGLRAFVVAFPYTLSPWMPKTLAILAQCVNDPEPLRSTARKTLSEFWRTHQENRQEMKELFTENELATITELMLSPSYYA